MCANTQICGFTYQRQSAVDTTLLRLTVLVIGSTFYMRYLYVIREAFEGCPAPDGNVVELDTNKKPTLLLQTWKTFGGQFWQLYMTAVQVRIRFTLDNNWT